MLREHLINSVHAVGFFSQSVFENSFSTQSHKCRALIRLVTETDAHTCPHKNDMAKSVTVPDEFLFTVTMSSSLLH